VVEGAWKELDFNQQQETYPGGRTKLEDSLDGSSHGGRLDRFLCVG
jgi:hypothetical protein